MPEDQKGSERSPGRGTTTSPLSSGPPPTSPNTHPSGGSQAGPLRLIRWFRRFASVPLESVCHRYLPVGSGSGELPRGGYYTTLVEPDGRNFTIQVRHSCAVPCIDIMWDRSVPLSYDSVAVIAEAQCRVFGGFSSSRLRLYSTQRVAVHTSQRVFFFIISKKNLLFSFLSIDFVLVTPIPTSLVPRADGPPQVIKISRSHAACTRPPLPAFTVEPETVVFELPAPPPEGRVVNFVPPRNRHTHKHAEKQG